MFLNAKKMAFLGLLLAATVLLVILSGILEFNTLFLLAGASFCVGIAIRESGLRYGFGFYLASILLVFMLATNKAYCATYAAMGLYIVISEFTYDKLDLVKWKQNRRKILWVIKYLIFNLMFLPMLLFFPKLIYQGLISKWLIVVFFIAGQIILLIYDKAYQYFQAYIWGKFRKGLHL